MSTVGPSQPSPPPARTPSHVERHTEDFDYTFVGSPVDVVTMTRPGAALIGGASGPDPAFRFLLDHGGGGDVVVLCANEPDGYNEYFQSLGPVNSVATVVTRTRQAAFDPFVVEQVRNAEVIFLQGGDQAKYAERWQGTPLQDALNDAAARGVPIGGSSAGLAVMADRPFLALTGGVSSGPALADPCGPDVTLGRDFLALPHMRHVVTDTHFHERDRMGRLVTFVAHVAAEGGPALGVGVDEHTALMVEGDGKATVTGPGSVYFLKAPGAPEQLIPGYPLRFCQVSVFRAREGDGFDFGTWQGSGGEHYTLGARDGRLHSSRGDAGPY